ncbi:hypothetical protein WICPIJ_008336 [Wickerhamomyces pijperi]|uniref:Uncharacterized protein n=1 Tax=Wickerhamomyces pijperi TaxID=599730 RepID=A0A9P8PZX2_WICPI|nr:hypothetical protein WICPIJ_008336 [Wickerhamomyces pijperi]
MSVQWQIEIPSTVGPRGGCGGGGCPIDEIFPPRAGSVNVHLEQQAFLNERVQFRRCWQCQSSQKSSIAQSVPVQLSNMTVDSEIDLVQDGETGVSLEQVQIQSDSLVVDLVQQGQTHVVGQLRVVQSLSFELPGDQRNGLDVILRGAGNSGVIS